MLTGTLVKPALRRGGRLGIEGIEGAWRKAVTAPAQFAQPITLDLQESTYIDQECLLYLVAVLADRDEHDMDTSLLLPDTNNAVDFLREWRFPMAVDAATRHGIDDFLERDDRSRVSSSEGTAARYVRVGDGGRESLVPLDFFAITRIEVGEDHYPEAEAARLRDNWLDSHLVPMLDRHLGGYAYRLATRVLYEGVLNAAVHPAATLVLTSSQVFAHPGTEENGLGEHVIVIWDNGRYTFDDTLRIAWHRSGSMTSAAYGQVDDTFEVRVSNHATLGCDRRYVMSTTEEINEADDREDLLVRAFVSGVTGHAVPPAESALKRAGLGLHYIRKTVIDIFGGSVLYATGRHRLHLTGLSAPTLGTVEQTRRGSEYFAKVTHLADSEPSVTGNLLVARIPVPPT